MAPFSFDDSLGTFVWKGDDSDWLGSPTVAAPSALDDAMRRIKMGNVEDQAKAADNYISQQGGLATATATAQGADSTSIQPRTFGGNTGSAGNATPYGGLADMAGQTPEQYAAAHGIDVESGRNSSSALAPLPLGAQQIQNVVRNVIPNVDVTSNQGQFLGSQVTGNALNDVGAPQPVVRAAKTAADVLPFAALGPGSLASGVVGSALYGAGTEVGQQAGVPDVPIIGNPVGLAAGFAPQIVGGGISAIRGRGEPPIAAAAERYTPEQVAQAREGMIRQGFSPAEVDAAIADAQNTPAPATSPAASSPPTGEAAAGQPAPAGAGPTPAAMTNRGEIPFDSVKQPNLPGLVDAEKFGVAQTWAARQPNIDPAIATDGQIRAGLYNAGFEPTVKGMNTPELARQGIPDLRSLYRELDRLGIKLPQEEPPSGMPDTRDIAMSRAPQNQEAAAAGGNGAGVPPETPPTQGFKDFMAERGKVYPLPRDMASDISNVGKGETFTDETGRAVANQGGTGGGTGRPTFGGPGERGGNNDRPSIERDPNRAVTLALNEINGIFHIPTSLQTIGPHPFRIGAGLELSNPSLIPKVEGAYLSGWKNPVKLKAALEVQRQAPGIAGDGAAGTRYADFQPPNPNLPRPIATQIMRVATGGENGILGRNSAAFTGRMDMLKMGAFEKQWEMGQKLGIEDPAWYQKQYQAIQHAGGQAFSGGRTPEAASLTLYAQAGLARLATVGDLIFGNGSPIGVGSRNIALKALLADGALDATILGISALTGAAVMTPFNTNLTNSFGVNSKIGKAVSGATSIDPSTGYLPMIRFVANLANDYMNNDQDMAAQHITSFARGQLGPIPGQIANVVLGQDYKGDPFTWKDLGSQKNLAEMFSPLGAKGMFDALTTPGGDPALAAWGLGGVSTTTKQPPQSFTDRMNKTGVDAKTLYGIQDTVAPYFTFLDQNQKQGMTVQEMNLAQQQYLAQHPEVVAALRQGGYSAPVPTSIQPRTFGGGTTGVNPRGYTGGTTSIQPRDFQQTYRTPTPFQPRNKQPVPVGAQ